MDFIISQLKQSQIIPMITKIVLVNGEQHNLTILSLVESISFSEADESESRISILRKLLILDFFPMLQPTSLIKALRLLNFRFFSMGYRYFHVLKLFFLANFPCPTFIQGPMFNIFVKLSRNISQKFLRMETLQKSITFT